MNIKKTKKRIIESLNGKKRYFVLTYDRGYIDITDFQAKDEEEANEILEETIQTNLSSDWLFGEEMFDKLINVIKNYKKWI